MMNKNDHLHFVTEDLEFLRQLCAIDSRTKMTENVAQVLKLVERKLQSLGFQITYIESTIDPNQKLLYASRIGDQKAPTFTFVSHADTVFSSNEVKEADGWLWGSGVADNKGGIICALRTIAHLDLLQDGEWVMRPNLHFVCSCSEETGSLGFHQFFSEVGLISDYVLGFEPATQEGHFISERNGNRWYEVEIKGKSSHAGRFGEPSLNAAHEAAMKIINWLKPIDESKKMKLNVGSFEGGAGHFNVVCGQVKVKLDMRFPSFEIRDQLHHHFLEVLDSSYTHCQITGEPTLSSYKIQDDCPPMPKSKKTQVLEQLAGIISKVEQSECLHGHSGGAADINYFSSTHNTCIDGLGPVAIGMHTQHERLLISSLESRPYALSLFINDILKNVFLRGAIDEREFIKSNTLEV